MSNYDGMGIDPAILAALRTHAAKFGPNFEGSLPRPGGPVDIGINQAAHPNLVPLPVPGQQTNHVLSMGSDARFLAGGGGGGGAWPARTVTESGPAITPELMQKAMQMFQVKKMHDETKPTPYQQRLAMVREAMQHAREHTHTIASRRNWYGG